MRILPLSAAIVGVLAVCLVLEARSDEDAKREPEGKKIFLQYKCYSCHSIKNEGIEHKKVAGEEEVTGSKKPPDLSDVGKKQDAAWISKFLLKQETLDGEHHKKKFRGKDSELKALSSWLESLKTPAKKDGENKATEKKKDSDEESKDKESKDKK
jgi:cbb3-type cytochrome oxidase cytochrome c subunit